MFEFPFIASAHFRPLPITLSTCLVLYQLRHLRLFYQSTSHILCHTEAVAAASADRCARWRISFPLPLVSVVHQLGFMPFAGYHPHWNNPEFIVKLGGDFSIVVRHTVWTSLAFYSGILHVYHSLLPRFLISFTHPHVPVPPLALSCPPYLRFISSFSTLLSTWTRYL